VNCVWWGNFFFLFFPLSFYFYCFILDLLRLGNGYRQELVLHSSTFGNELLRFGSDGNSMQLSLSGCPSLLSPSRR
jgi:hypothetical protein